MILLIVFLVSVLFLIGSIVLLFKENEFLEIITVIGAIPLFFLVIFCLQNISTNIDNCRLELKFLKEETKEYKELQIERKVYKSNFWLVDMSWFLIKTEIKEIK